MIIKKKKLNTQKISCACKRKWVIFTSCFLFFKGHGYKGHGIVCCWYQTATKKTEEKPVECYNSEC